MVKTTIPTQICCRHTPRARGVVVASITLIIAGVGWVDGALGAIGLSGLFFIALARAVGALNLRHLAITIEAPQRAISGVPYPLRLKLTNTRRLFDAHDIAVTANLPGDTELRLDTRWVAAGAGVDFDRHAVPQTRADKRNIPISIESHFPLGLFEFRCQAAHPHLMVVLPYARKPRESPDDGVMFDTSPMTGSTFGATGGDFRGLRGWHRGDSPRQIAWPASMRSIARGSTPVVRESDPPGFHPHRCLIVLHSFASGGTLISPERFERSLELACGWIERLKTMGIHIRIVADFDGWVVHRAHTREEIIRCRERLARAKRRKSTEAHELHQAVYRSTEEGETVILLSDMPAESWRIHIPKLTPTPMITQV